MNKTSSRPLRRVALLLASAALLAGACQMYDQIVTPMFMMSTEQEAALGKQVAQEVEKQMKFVNDPTMLAYVRKLGSYVTGYAPKKAEFPTQFFIINNPEINAFAIPGGNMYVHTGLLEAAEDESEILGVMAHEYGHVLYRHSAKQASRTTGAQTLSSLVLGDQAGIASSVGGLVASGALQSYSRQDELEADSVAVPTLYASGYDPNGMVSLFQTLKQRYGEQSGLMLYFSSHPATSDRIQRVQASIAALPPKQYARPVAELRQIQARIEDLGLSGKKAAAAKAQQGTPAK